MSCIKVTAILLHVRILPIGGVASGRVCVCSLSSRLVLSIQIFYQNNVTLDVYILSDSDSD